MTRSMRPVGAMMTLAVFVVACGIVGSSAFAGDFAYVGSKNCKKCHLKEHKSWAETKMAKSFDGLKAGAAVEAKKKAGLEDKDYTKDAACLGCHTTGYGKTGGFVDEASTPDLMGVGCESCHGPGGTYTEKQHMSLDNKEYKKAELVKVGLVDTVGEAQCTTCHNEKSPFAEKGKAFDFAANKDKGTHEHFPLKYTH